MFVVHNFRVISQPLTFQTLTAPLVRASELDIMTPLRLGGLLLLL